MKLPFLFLPRTVYDDMRADKAALETRIKELQTLLLDLKLDGAQIVHHNPEYRRAAREKPVDLIDEALESHPKAKNNPQMRRHWRIWADKQIADGKMSEEEVVFRIRNWDKVEAASSDDEDEEDRRMGLIAS